MKKIKNAKNTKTLGRMCFNWMIPAVEYWLEQMAAEGWLLCSFNHVIYYFQRSEPMKCRYYIISPELGSNDGTAVANELQGKGAVIFGTGVRRFGGPEFVLRMGEETSGADLKRYYLKRNSRIISSMLSMMGAFGCLALCIIAYFGFYAKDLQSALFGNLFLLLIAGAFGIFLRFFICKCKKNHEPYSFSNSLK